MALLALLWGVLIASSEYKLPWAKWLANHNEWLLLTGAGLLVMLALLKDRGLMSIHGVTRVAFIGLVGALSYGWLLLIGWLKTKFPQAPWAEFVLPYLPLTVPLVVIAGVLLWRSLTENSLTQAALVVTLGLWLLQHFALLALPWAVVALVLTLFYLLAVITDSYFLAYRDDLTGLPSRRALNQLALSLGRKYVVVMADIDHFKKFNDTYGHDIGDQVLKLVAAKLAKVKGGGKVFRYGGEEFTIVYPRKTTEYAIPHLEVLRQAIADYKIVVRKPVRQTKQSRTGKGKAQADHKSVSVTISMGVAPREGKLDFEQTLKQADVALYRAKKKGRNNVSE
jgi:diguanylate cyclase (GGDEF)-like protein